MMMEAQAWKMDIVDNYPVPTLCRDILMMILINKRDCEAVVHVGSGQDYRHQGEITQEQLVELATNNGFSSWYVRNLNKDYPTKYSFCTYMYFRLQHCTKV